jgi:hypothetical protein
MFWVLAVLLVRGVCSSPEREETIFVYTEEIAPPYREIEEKNCSVAKGGFIKKPRARLTR